MEEPRYSAKSRVLVAVCISVAIVLSFFLLSGEARAHEGQWKYGGSSAFKVYWQNALRIDNSTSLYIFGTTGPLRVGVQAKVLAANWGIPGEALMLGPLGEWTERWSVSLQAPTASLQLGDVYIPTMSGLYLAGRSLHGGVGSVWGSAGGVSGTVTGFCGTNAVSSGFTVNSYQVSGGSAEASFGRKIGLSLRGLSGERDGFDVDLVGARIWAALGNADITGELVGSRNNPVGESGYTALAGARVPACGGVLSLSGKYASDEFVSLNPAVSGSKGGNAETSISWSGDVLRSSAGHAMRFAVTGTLAADNMDGSAPVQNVERSAESQVTLVSGRGQLIEGKYTVLHWESDEEPAPNYIKTKHVASIESAFPVKMGPGTVDVGTRAIHSVVIDHVGRFRDALDLLSMSGAGSIGETEYVVKAGWSRSVRDTAGYEKRDLEASLSLSRPIAAGLFIGGLNATAYDSRAFGAGDAEPESVKDALKVRVWLRYASKPWMEAAIGANATRAWKGPEMAPHDLDCFIQGELKVRF